MNIDNYQISKKQLLATIIILVGLIVTVILVQRPQIFKGRASGDDVFNSINIYGNEGDLKQNCTWNGPGEYTCQTESDEVQLDLSGLIL